MIPVLCDQISELGKTQKLSTGNRFSLSDLVRVNQPRIEFGFSFPVESSILWPAFLLQNDLIAGRGQDEIVYLMYLIVCIQKFLLFSLHGLKSSDTSEM